MESWINPIEPSDEWKREYEGRWAPPERVYLPGEDRPTRVEDIKQRFTDEVDAMWREEVERTVMRGEQSVNGARRQLLFLDDFDIDYNHVAVKPFDFGPDWDTIYLPLPRPISFVASSIRVLNPEQNDLTDWINRPGAD